MRHPGTVAFALVLALTAPGTWRPLNAEGGAAPPPTRTLKVGAATLTVALDRQEVRPGEGVLLAMSMDNPSSKERVVEVEVELLERQSMPMARVMPPPVVRARHAVRLAAAAHAVRTERLALTAPDVPRAARGIGRTFRVRITAKGTAAATSLAFVERPAPARKAGAADVPQPPAPALAAAPTPAAAAGVPQPPAPTHLAPVHLAAAPRR